ncbi:MAG: tRNA uridine-5-carboxymethylaminomethyl(34) synthesis GTPase MnmE [Oscillospiraceae bacterium]|nr:tRNA uridine-5-carboxymethylaminomethyl(34) synthesis GTPase MnmE [Oscillospiraceae bacterium]MBP1554876.1 tRNA uridine-5-carboxymethylaminomethyl(34) synthesis GTPase MnmE [Oscillospiraceae bacterium]MBQ5342126.1 tRNA uridine-5-carboxymethylaminomethyl(34) synthesis GTPase MnmE [Oscillospiraceae bacterium]
MNYGNSVIAAISTPAGKGGIGIVRISGDEALAVAGRVFRAKNRKDPTTMKGYTAAFGTVHKPSGELIDQAILLCFRAPKSYTGEDVAEIQCHGGEAAIQEVLRAVLDSGAEPAGRGEFTRRAFLSGRISLTEAEAVMEIVNAASAQGERAAASQAEGSLARRTQEYRDRILAVQTQIAAEIDFPEEDVDEADREQLTEEVTGLASDLSSLIKKYDAGQKLLRGIPAAIVGSPNVGKSTILNLISGYEKAIVSPEAGTTRDIIEEQVTLGGLTLMLADTAGIRENASGEVERIGIDRARSRLLRSSLILAVFDVSRPLDEDDLALIGELRDRQVLAVINKNDLPAVADTEKLKEAFPSWVEISAVEEGALEKLENAIAEMAGVSGFDTDSPLLANERQRSCAVRAYDALSEAAGALQKGYTLDVCYALLDEALSVLYELSGENASEEVIDAVFRDFCVGK